MKKILTIMLGLVVGMFSFSSTEIKTETNSEKLAKEIQSELKIIEIKLNSVPKIEDEEIASSDSNDKDEKAKYTHYQTGIASFYGGKWHGRRTANGEIFDTYKLTAAHKTLPFNTRVRVTNLSNGKSVMVRINNRGPYSKGRIIDLSQAAFSAIENTRKGVTKVKLEIVK